jgi:hypothetical protein
MVKMSTRLGETVSNIETSHITLGIYDPSCCRRMLCVVHVRLKKVRSCVRIDCNVAHNQSTYLFTIMHNIHGEKYTFAHVVSLVLSLRQSAAQVKSQSNFTTSIGLTDLQPHHTPILMKNKYTQHDIIYSPLVNLSSMSILSTMYTFRAGARSWAASQANLSLAFTLESLTTLKSWLPTSTTTPTYLIALFSSTTLHLSHNSSPRITSSSASHKRTAHHHSSARRLSRSSNR